MAAATSESVARYYDAYWARGDRRYEPEPELWRLILADLGPSEHCLDVGCGTANSYATVVAGRAGAYVGVDVSHAAVAAVRTAGLDARVVADATELPFEDDTFDRVICVEVLEHLFAPGDAAAEIRRVMKPGGRLIASVPNAAYWRMRANLLFGLWNPAGDEDAIERPWRDPHLRFFTLATFERMLREAGFSRVSVGACGGRGLDHATSRPTRFGSGRAYRAAERRLPSLLGAVIHAVAEV
jgi:SAM-dependent methyltransferase